MQTQDPRSTASLGSFTYGAHREDAESSHEEEAENVADPGKTDPGWGRGRPASGRVTSVATPSGGGAMYPGMSLGSRIATRLAALASLTTIVGIIVGVP